MYKLILCIPQLWNFDSWTQRIRLYALKCLIPKLWDSGYPNLYVWNLELETCMPEVCPLVCMMLSRFSLYLLSNFFFCTTFVVSSTERLLFVFMSYWCSYSWAIVLLCMILYCVLFHITISNFREIVDSTLDHKWWCLLGHAVSCHIVITVISVVEHIHAAFCVPSDQTVVLFSARHFLLLWRFLELLVSVGADFFLLLLGAVHNLSYFPRWGSDQPQHPPLSREPLFLKKVVFSGRWESCKDVVHG